jgi:hypothetical protein
LPLTEGATQDEAGASDAEVKAQLLNNVILPELQRDADERCDLARVGEAVSQLQNLGSKRVEVVKQPGGLQFTRSSMQRRRLLVRR